MGATWALVIPLDEKLGQFQTVPVECCELEFQTFSGFQGSPDQLGLFLGGKSRPRGLTYDAAQSGGNALGRLVVLDNSMSTYPTIILLITQTTRPCKRLP